MSDQPTDLYSNRGDTANNDGPEVANEAKFSDLKKKALTAWSKRTDWRNETIRAYDFVANHQWSEEDERALKAQNRPTVSFNRVAPIIKAVCGLEVNNRQTVAYLPRQQDSEGVDEAVTNCAKWVRDECMAEDEESEAFRDMAICGEGWVETRMDFDNDPKGKIVEERIDPLEMCPDESASRQNYVDARMLFRVRTMSSEDAKDLFDEDYSSEDLHAGWIDDMLTPADGGTGNKTDYPTKTRGALQRESGMRTKVRIVQVQWWEREPCYLVAEDGAQDVKEMSEEEYSTYVSRVDALKQADMAALQAHTQALTDYTDAAGALAAQGMAPTAPPPAQPVPQAPSYNAVKSKRKCYYEAFLGQKLLAMQKLEMSDFKFRSMTAERDRKQKCFYGMLRDMFDPQMWTNKWISQTLNIMNTNAKGGLLAETDAFVDQRKAQRDWSDPTKIVWVKPGSIKQQKIKERTPPPLPQGLNDLLQFALSSLRDVTGVNLELLGQADREQAASLEAQRRQAAMTILASLFDSLRRFRKEQGRLLLHYMKLLPPGTLYRVLEKGEFKFIPFMMNSDVENYDIIMDQTPSSPDQKQAIWALTLELIRGGIPLSPPAIVALLKYSPYPEKVVQEIMGAMGLTSDLPPEVLKQKLDQAEQALQVMEKQLQQAMAEANTEQSKLQNQQMKIQLDHARDQLNVQIAEYDAQTRRLTTEITGISAALNAQNELLVKTLELSTPKPSDEPV